MSYLITGVAGFIGRAVACRLLENGHRVVGVDNFSNYYSVNLKKYRLKSLSKFSNFNFIEEDINNLESSELKKYDIDFIVHLAAQPGVRLSPSSYKRYIDANLTGFLKICELVKAINVTKFIYASSSSVYGNNSTLPFFEDQLSLSPESFYGYTKLLNEKIAKEYFQTDSDIAHIGLRFFTVFGPYGRPDMLYSKIIFNLLYQKELTLYGDGSIERDFTYIDDVVESIMRLTSKMNIIKSKKVQVINVGGGKPNSMNNLILELEKITGKKAIFLKSTENPSDMKKTLANFDLLQKITEFKPNTDFRYGLQKIVYWMKEEVEPHELNKWFQK